MSVVPPIYALNRPSPPLGITGRGVALAISLSCLAVLITAAWLHPDPSGLATHEQLGMRPCGMLYYTGVPCFTCGMTTSFSYLAHGDVVHSFLTQPAGLVFGFLTAVGFWLGAYIAFTGRPSARIIDRLPVSRLMYALLAIAVAGWAYKIVVVVRSHAA